MTHAAGETFASFAPVCDRRCKVLVLGSLPGVLSVAANQYYAHPRNHFWPIMSNLPGDDLISLPYEGRLERLVAHKVGLWDSVQSALRHRSNDATIARDARLNAVQTLVAGLPDLRLIAFNGQTAARFGQPMLAKNGPFSILVMPSTSPANTMLFERKLASWRAILTVLQDDRSCERGQALVS